MSIALGSFWETDRLHAAATIELCDFFGVRTYIAEPKLPRPVVWADQPEEQRRAAMNNRRRMERSKGKAMQRRRSEVVERTFAHVCETSGSRRSHLLGLVNVAKRYLIAVAAHNLGRIMRCLVGVGKPRVLQGAIGGLIGLIWCLATLLRNTRTRVTNSLWKMSVVFRLREDRGVNLASI